MRIRTMTAYCAMVMALAASASAAGLEVKEGRLVKDGKAYRGVGANYYDLFVRMLHKPEETSSLEGLKRLADAGIPFVRFSGCGFSARDWKLYLENKEEHWRRMDRVVRAAEKAGIGLIPSVFWTQILPDLVDEPRDQWGNLDSKTIALMRQYTGELVKRYKDSPAIWAWEFGNEINLAVDLPNAVKFRKKGGTERDDLKSQHMVVALSEFAKEVRRHDARRAIFSGNSHPRASAWHNTAEKSWKADTKEQSREIILRDNPAPLDTIGVHLYGGSDVQKELGAWVKDRGEYLRWLKGVGREAGRPVFVGEFGSAEGLVAQQATMEQLIAEMEAAQIDLAAFWVFDLANQSKDWSVTFENERAYVIKLTAEANRRWNGTINPRSPGSP